MLVSRRACVSFGNSGKSLPVLATPSIRPATKHCTSVVVVAAAKKGFGEGDAKVEKKQPKFTRYLDNVPAAQGSSSKEDDGWFVVPDVNTETTFLSKPIKPIILATGKAIMLYKIDETLYCTDANSTAYQYPLADANIIQLKSGPAVEVKLDGTVYDLATGKVISWCPKNSFVRKVLGSLKDKAEPVDLPIYPIRADKNGAIFVKLAK